ncbi:unnamed protein product [Rotaria socialis]|uniref:Aminotransferase class V domain-containing protein n=1 Tax=Rotaria socialis TaxID=392032 RepID=A0A818C809_9BILA|nr:unnamed protein product [Rotaria socialis]CAF3429049.1 unnamed protein product [Rotaria socialis]CAF4170471.1 unnamed protein product [Rotaria socialis]CAF4336784.1 unnamed protein product [Rotaria socialis]
MYSYTPTQLFSMHPHQYPLHQAVYIQQQQDANLLYHQYNQLNSIQAAYSTPALTSLAYTQQAMNQSQQQQQQQQQQLYRTDQLVPLSSAQMPTPIQQQIQQQVQQQMQQQIPRSSPVTMRPLSSSDAWIPNNSMPQNQDIIRSLTHAFSQQMVNVSPYNQRTNSISSNSSALPLSASYESPASTLYHLQNQNQNQQQSVLPQPQHQPPTASPPTPEDYTRRQRLHSGSSCYESDSADISSDDEDEFGWRPTGSKTFRTISSMTKSRSNSAGRSDPSTTEIYSNDIYQKSNSTNNNSGIFPSINKMYRSSSKNNNGTSRPKLVQYIDDNIIGKDYIFNGPWGLRRMIYCDYTASGRPLEFIEDYLRNYVLPLYGNTHSETSLCAQQATRFREEARNIIKKSVNATEDDVLLFTGTGSTGAVHTLVSNFNFNDVNSRKNAVVMVSAFEHHSNILPWTETGVEVIRIPTTQQGILDLSVLKAKLQHYSNLKKLIICSLNAASNITGIYTDVDTVSTLVHSYSGLMFWDYATAAPYMKIDMNSSATAYKDAVFISTHKFLGGPGTPGILIAKKNLFSLKPPKSCGGGTVNFVTRTCREYNYDIEIREEGGTPDIIGCIKAGLVFQLKDSIDSSYIQAREEELVKRFYRRFKKNETLVLLGSQTAARLPIFSFSIYIPGVCKYLHQNLVCLLFNDLFGIQVRSGCACAGPYALDLLNINDAKTDTYCLFMTENTNARGNEGIVRTMMMKPGFTRLNLPYFSTDEEIDYIFNAIEFIAAHGWKFLPLYTYDPTTASWSHRNDFQLAQSSLEDISYKSGKMQYYGKKVDLSSTRGEKHFPDPLREARLLAGNAVKYALEVVDYTSDPPLNIPDKYQHMVWFAVPIDIALMLLKKKETGQEPQCDVNSIPFIPDEAKKKILDSMKTKSIENTRDASANRKKHNAKRDPTTSQTR